MNPVFVVLLIAGLIVAGTGAAILAARGRSAGGFTRTRATLVAVMQADGPNTVKPVVEFQADGETVRQSTGAVGTSSLTAKVGDEVDIVYRRTNAMGMKGWDIILDQNDVDGILANRNRSSAVLGWLFLGIGAVIIIVAVVLMRR